VRLVWKEGELRLEQLARFLERDCESAATQLARGNVGNVHAAAAQPSLYKGLATTNLMESPQSGVAPDIRALGCLALVITETRFPKNLGHRELWELATILERKTENAFLQEKVA